MATRGYTVKLDAFEGPLDLLLHLVRTNELDIYHLPIATITDQYLAYLEMFEELNLDIASEYLVMAASLTYMKSRLLLPTEDDDEEAEEENPVQDLVRQLAEYSRYREAAEALRDRALLDRDVFRRAPLPADDFNEPGEIAPIKIELGDLFEGLRRVLQAAAARKPHMLPVEDYSVAECVRSVIAKLRSTQSMQFEDVFEDTATRGYIVATFIGLLEMLKLCIIEARQDVNRGPILLSLIDKTVDDRVFELIGTYGAGDLPGVSAASEESTAPPDPQAEA